MALQVQEATLREFLAKSGALARGTGFLARFLMAWPESTQGYRPFTEAPKSWPHLGAALNAAIGELVELDRIELKQHEKPLIIKVNPALVIP